MTADRASLLESNLGQGVHVKIPSTMIKSYISSKMFTHKMQMCKEERTAACHYTEGIDEQEPSGGR